MTIKELRKELQLTQIQVSEIVNVPLRTYKLYENDPNKIGSMKYKPVYLITIEPTKTTNQPKTSSNMCKFTAFWFTE